MKSKSQGASIILLSLVWQASIEYKRCCQGKDTSPYCNEEDTFSHIFTTACIPWTPSSRDWIVSKNHYLPQLGGRQVDISFYVSWGRFLWGERGGGCLTCSEDSCCTALLWSGLSVMRIGFHHQQAGFTPGSSQKLWMGRGFMYDIIYRKRLVVMSLDEVFSL